MEYRAVFRVIFDRTFLGQEGRDFSAVWRREPLEKWKISFGRGDQTEVERAGVESRDGRGDRVGGKMPARIETR